MITKINFSTEINIPGPSTANIRRAKVLLHCEQQAREKLVEKGSKKGQKWDFIIKTEEILCSNGEFINSYTDEFSLVI